MYQTAVTKYKLMILTLLDRSDSPLTNTLLSDFFLEKGYTDYFTLQETLHSLSESGLIRQEPAHHNTLYGLTPAGEETLGFFKNELSRGILDDINAFLDSHSIQIKNETNVYAGYDRTIEKEYAVRCRLKEKGITKLDFTITVPKKETAEAICENWKNDAVEIYDILRDTLIK